MLFSIILTSHNALKLHFLSASTFPHMAVD